MNHTTVCLIVGAGRTDYVTPHTMPFLDGLSKGGFRGGLEAPAGFAQHDAIFSGKYPDTAGHFTRYSFDPERSPFRWVRPFGRSTGAPRISPAPTRLAVDRLTRWLHPTSPSDPVRIPLTQLPFFAPNRETRPLGPPHWHRPNDLFDLCRKRGVRYRYHGARDAKGDDPIQDALVRDLRAGDDTQLHVARFAGPEETARREGPFSDAQLMGELRTLDDRIASIHAALTAGHDSWTLLVCGDHGMAPVQREVDILAAIARADARPARDYVVFVHSTMVSLWYLTEQGRRAVEAVLPDIEGTYLVDTAERERLRIPTDRLWGDRILAAEPGILFRPDYFHSADTPLRGMHGYLDKADEGNGMAVITSNDGKTFPCAIGDRPLVDVFPTLCDMVGLPIPYGQEGTSIFRDNQHDPTMLLGRNGRNGKNGHGKGHLHPEATGHAVLRVEP